MSSQPLVLVVGATGRTGGSIVDALVKSGKFRVAALVRPASASKPEVAEFRKQGLEIRLGDIQSDSVEKLKDTVSGVEILISAVVANLISSQKAILTAANEVGVKRVIPCDFGTPGAPGVHDLRDEKFAIHDLIGSLGVGYTFIDIGWWMQYVLPYPSESDSLGSMSVAISREFYGEGNKKNMYTNAAHIGNYVARIIADDRTLNQYVIVWEDELTLEEAKSLGEKASGEEAILKAKRIPVPAEELLRRIASGKEEAPRTQSLVAIVNWVWSQYQYSMHVLGENSLENAKRLGALDVRELYPDIDPMKLAEYVHEFYESPPPVSF